MEGRESWIDSWKGLLIFLVVLGHVVGGFYHYVDDEGQRMFHYVYKVIYLFHMPAFFILAGWLMGRKRSMGRPQPSFGNFLMQKVQRLLVPYAFWGVLSVVVYLFLSQHIGSFRADATDNYYRASKFAVSWGKSFLALVHAGGWPRGNGFRCNGVLWFLPCFFVVLLAQNGLDRVVTKWRLREVKGTRLAEVAFIVVLFALGGWLKIHVGDYWPWGLSRAPRYWAFLLVGVLIGEHNLFRSAKLPLCLVLLAVYFAAAYFYPDLILSFRHWPWYWVEIGLGLCGCVISAVIAQRFNCGILSFVGGLTLGIMLMHKFFVLGLQLLYAQMADLHPILLLGGALVLAALVLALSLSLTLAVRRIAPALLGERRLQHEA